MERVANTWEWSKLTTYTLQESNTSNGNGGKLFGWEMMVKLVPSKSSWWFQTFFSFTPKIGKMIQFDEHIFQMG